MFQILKLKSALVRLFYLMYNYTNKLCVEGLLVF